MHVVAAARELAPVIRARIPDLERERTLPADLAATLAAAGLFRTLLPAAAGGLELPPLEALASMEAVGRADASAGWCTMIGATSGMAAAWLDPAVAASIHDRADTVTGGVFAPMGRAVEAGGDYLLDGRWAWASGHAHCRWLGLGCVVMRDGQPVAGANGQPQVRMLYVPIEAVERHDGWHSAGLVGTGSGEVSARGLRVPRERSVALADEPPRDPGPLYRMPVFGLLAQGIAWTMLGNAAAAIDELVELAGGKRPAGGRRTLAERATVQVEVAKAVAALAAARAACVDAVGEAWRQAAAGDAPSLEARAMLRLAATHATRTAADVARTAYDLGGGSSVYLSSPLQRRFRDAHVGTQHAMVAPATLELAGRVLLGLPTDATLL